MHIYSFKITANTIQTISPLIDSRKKFYIVGRGGDGGGCAPEPTWGSKPSPGQAGGPAFFASTNIWIDNRGIIGGGGSGGTGGGAGNYNNIRSYGPGGGGGAGYYSGSGGWGDYTGGNGSLLAGGARNANGARMDSGAGGSLGQKGGVGYYWIGPGNLGVIYSQNPGNAITGNSEITWLVTGDRRGAIS